MPSERNRAVTRSRRLQWCSYWGSWRVPKVNKPQVKPQVFPTQLPTSAQVHNTGDWKAAKTRRLPLPETGVPSEWLPTLTRSRSLQLSPTTATADNYSAPSATHRKKLSIGLIRMSPTRQDAHSPEQVYI